MTRAEAEVFIKTVIGPGDVMDIDQIRQKYRDMTLQEALRDHLGKIADYFVQSRAAGGCGDVYQGVERLREQRRLSAGGCDPAGERFRKSGIVQTNSRGGFRNVPGIKRDHEGRF